MEDFKEKLNHIDRYSPSTGTCYTKNYENIFDGFFSQFQNSYFFANVIQFLIVALIYIDSGSGKYWHILFYAALSNFIGSLIENTTVAYLCLDSNKDDQKKTVVTFFINEVFWTFSQYAVPFLNLIKMKALSKGKMVKVVNNVIIGLFFPFAFIRFFIGFRRMMRGYLQDEEINTCHGSAYGVLAIADVICTVSVLYFVKKNNSQMEFSSTNITNHVKNSSYTTLVTVDIIGFILSILDIITNLKIAEDFIPFSITVPFQCIMSNFILILAIDALLFKYGIRTGSGNGSNGTRSGKNTGLTSHEYSRKYSTYTKNYLNMNKDFEYDDSSDDENYTPSTSTPTTANTPNGNSYMYYNYPTYNHKPSLSMQNNTINSPSESEKTYAPYYYY